MAEVEVVVPPWKTEMLERKRRKTKIDEVPQWKRELLKRIQSKSQRMSADQQEQPDILEEHIPKVSDNIFLVHEKKQQHRYPSAPLPKTTSQEMPSAISLSVDSVIIIEKQNKDVGDEASSTSSSDSVFGASAEDKEYPRVGIVHRLMGRFQAERSAPSYVDKAQHAQKQIRPTARTVTRPPPTLHIAPAMQKPALNLTPSESDAATIQSDLLTPLLMSSAKPFSRQNTQSASDHRYHHVNVPVRKPTTPTSPKYTVPARFEPAPGKTVNPEPSWSSFTEDLSSLHSNREGPAPSVAVKEAFVIQPDVIAVPKRVNLSNGGTLHSSGSEPQPRSVLVKEQRRTPLLRDKSNFSTYNHFATPQETKRSDCGDRKTRFELPKKEAIVIPKQPAIEPEIRVSSMKENRAGYAQIASKHHKPENRFKRVVNESFDESTLKSGAAVAANRIMKTSKTFKVTPSRQGQNSLAPKTALTPTPKSDPAPIVHKTQTASIVTPTHSPKAVLDGSNFKITSPAPLTRHGAGDNAHTNTSQSMRNISFPTGTWPPVKPQSDLPSTSIDDIVDSSGSVAVNPVSSFLVLPQEVKKVQQQVPAVKHAPAISPGPPKEMKYQNTYATRTSTSDNISNTSKSETNPKISLPFGPKVAKSSSLANCGKSFVIDPSKFRKSAAQPPTVASSLSSATQEVPGTRTVVPSLKGSVSTEAGFHSPKTGKRKLTVDQITVIGGYVSLEKSCLAKKDGRRKSVTLSFSENGLNKTYTYASERSLLREEAPTGKSPGFAKDSAMGKYTPKYLLSMKAADFPDDEEDGVGAKASSPASAHNGQGWTTANNANPVPDDTAATWSNSGSADLLF